MAKPISATDANNNFGGLLHDVQMLGSVGITQHGRVLAIVLSPRVLQATVRS
ncbi:MAG: type II toxin-antitoxin system prevent-host-death family antitoxin [Steroidobacteraceae bacterium]